MSDEAGTADVDDASVNVANFGRVYEVDDRFLGVPPPLERTWAIAFWAASFVLAVAWYFVTLETRTFEEASRANTRPLYEAYLAAYPDGEFVDQARDGIDHLVWDVKLKEQDFEGYLKEFPAGRHVGSARQAIDDRLYREKKAEGTLDAFRAYLAAYADGRHTKAAKLEIERIGTSQFNNCMNTCVESKGEPTPRDNFIKDCCLVCAGDWKEGGEGAAQDMGPTCSQGLNEDGSVRPPPADAPGVTPTGALPPAPVEPAAPDGGAAPPPPPTADAPTGTP